MRKIIYYLVLAMFIVSCGVQINKQAEIELRSLLDNENYFELRNAFNKYKSEISEVLLLEVEAYLLNTFNKNEASNKVIDKLFLNYSELLSDSLKVELYEVQADNYLKLFEFKNALAANDKVLENYKAILDSVQLDEFQNMSKIYRPLVDVEPQQVIITNDNFIPIKRDVVGLMNVEVELKGKHYDFIYDTGAGMPVIKRGFAEELNLPIYETSIDVKAATGNIVKSSLAVIDSLKIGNILVLNSVFLVMENEMLEFPQINFFPLAAIGFPIMEEFKEFTITKTDTLIVPKEPTHKNIANMRLNGLTPHVYLFNGTDSLEYAFDSGATKSHFTSKYFEKYQEFIEQTATLDTVTNSSAGGAKQHQAYLIDSTQLFIGSKKAVFDKIHVHTNLNETFEDVYGNLGQDLIRQFNSMTLNFEDMYLVFE